MPSWSNYEKEILDELRRRDAIDAAGRPSTNCPRHGETKICEECGECLSCITDTVRESWISYCTKQGHTFLNLSAPCKYCSSQARRESGHILNHLRNSCYRCFFAASRKRDKEMAKDFWK